MDAPGKGFSFAGTKNIPADRIEIRFCPNKPGDPPKLAFPIHLGSVNIKNNRLGSFWKLKSSDLFYMILKYSKCR